MTGRIPNGIRPILAALWLVPLTALHAAAAAPQIIRVSDPVRPDETVVVMGEGFDGDSVVELGRLADGQAAAGGKEPPPPAGPWETVQPLQTSPQCLKFVIPKSWTQGVWACRVRQGGAVSAPAVLNAPDPWWWNGDGGGSASPGGWLRVFGKSLHLGGGSAARLKDSVGRTIDLTPSASSGYELAFALPPDLAPGDYPLSVYNGLGGESAWRSAGIVTVRPRPEWKSEVFHVKDFGPKPAEALVAALKAAETNGGGIVYLPRGRYPVKDTLKIPPHTVVRGEAMELVSLYWPDFEKPPADLVTGADFGMESLSLYCQNHRNVIADTAASTRIFLRRVRIRANAYFMVEEAGKEFRGHRAPASHRDCGAAVLLRGANFEISDCDIYASNYGVRILKAKTGIIARNQIRYGGRGYSLENTERLIFEDNLVAGNNLLAIGNDISTFWSNYCR
ncbi:MAG: right-handed parallel beta-helix repeat-containing protein, partial [Verrucomicrobia bacterium]|nr:right-handed parallel beta-helix repeat-containing protein [Verrucomicrobiota bacterium]